MTGIPNVIVGHPQPVAGMQGAYTELERIKGGLGFIDKFILDRKINREAKRALGDAYLQYIEAKRQELITKVTLGLDDAKKRALVESMRTSAEIDREIGILSEEFANTLLDGAFSGQVMAAKSETKKLQDLEDSFQRKQFTQKRYEQLKEAAEDTANQLNAIIKDVAARIIAGHIGKVQLALQLFKERQLPSLN